MELGEIRKLRAKNKQKAVELMLSYGFKYQGELQTAGPLSR